MIYEQLRTSLKEESINSFYAFQILVGGWDCEYPVYCRDCDHEYLCCKQHELMLAMVGKILEWLKEHKDKLQDIDYADDVDLNA